MIEQQESQAQGNHDSVEEPVGVECMLMNEPDIKSNVDTVTATTYVPEDTVLYTTGTEQQSISNYN
jgi:hypothetical protein